MLDKTLVFPEDDPLTIPTLANPYIKCTFKEEPINEEHLKCIQNDSPPPLSATPFYFTKIRNSKVICHERDVKTTMEMFLDVKDLGFNYLPGDSVGILPKNKESEVEEVLKLLDIRDLADDLLEISLIDGVSKKKLPSYIPRRTTARIILETCIDLRSIVKKVFIRALSEYTSEFKERRRLIELCCKEGTYEYNKNILEKSSCLLDVLETFPHCKPPLSLLLEHLPRLMPRAYSIASSPLHYPDSIRIVFNLVKDPRNRGGLCSTWLYEKSGHRDLIAQFKDLKMDDREVDNKLPIFLRKRTQFRLPENRSCSLIMIGPGTGVAPFIGFLEHRIHQLANRSCNSENVLLFGCRYQNADYLYKEYLQTFCKQKILNKLLTCFSPEGNDNEKRKYVQDLFTEEKELLVNLLLKEGTSLFICGDALNMAKDVQEVIVKCISKVQGISLDEALIIVQKMEKDGKFVKDVWR